MTSFGSLFTIRILYFRAFFCTSHQTVYAIKLKREAMYFLCPFLGRKGGQHEMKNVLQERLCQRTVKNHPHRDRYSQIAEAAFRLP